MTHTYLHLLRGINVGGKRKVKMEDLRSIYIDLGFKEVKSYIQSGNIVFKSDVDLIIEKTEKTISKSLVSKFGFEISAILISAERFIHIFDSNPFINHDPKVLFVTIFNKLPVDFNLETLKQENEDYALTENCIYLKTPNGYRNTKLQNSVLEKKLQVTATTRNWKTMAKLRSMVAIL